MDDYNYEAERGANSPEGRQKMADLTAAIAYIADAPDGVIFVGRTDWIDERPLIRWVSLDHGHIDGLPETEVLHTINVKFTEKVVESIKDNDTLKL